MSAHWLAWLALLPLIVLNARRWLLLRSLHSARAALKAEAIEALGAGYQHQYKRRAKDIAALDRRINQTYFAPPWRWTP